MSIGLHEAHTQLGSHGATQGFAAMFSLAYQSTPIGYVVAACVAAVITQVAIFVRGEIEARRRFARHREEVAADVKAWSGVNRPIPSSSPDRGGDTDEGRP